MSICLQSFVHNAMNTLFASVPAARSNPDDYEVSVCNANGIDLLLALGLALESMSEPYTIDAFAGLVTTASAEPDRMTPRPAQRLRRGASRRPRQTHPARPRRRDHAFQLGVIASPLIHNPTGATGSAYRWTVQEQGGRGTGVRAVRARARHIRLTPTPFPQGESHEP